MVFDLVGKQQAKRIAAQASIENADTYSGNIGFYRERNYSYIPIPSAGQFYKVDEDEMKEMGEGQILRDNAHLIEVMVVLREHPFVLLDYHGVLSDQSDLAAKLGLNRNEEDRYGIVTVADLNKRRVKEMLYPAIVTFEHTLADLITNHYPDSDVPEDDVKDGAFERWSQAKEQGIETHIVDYMSLGDIVSVVRNTNALRTRCGFNSKSQYDDAIGGLVDLRNKVMHPRRTLITDSAHVEKTLDRVSRIKDLDDTVQLPAAD